MVIICYGGNSFNFNAVPTYTGQKRSDYTILVKNTFIPNTETLFLDRTSPKHVEAVKTFNLGGYDKQWLLSKKK